MDELVSVIVPIYNTECITLKKCISSIVNQTYENIEIILVDDGSEIALKKEYDKLISDNDKRIKIIHKKNEGVSNARNLGINIAIGKYIAFIDSDDYVKKDYIKRLYESLKQTNSDICFTSSNKIYKNSIEKQKIYKLRDKSILLKNSKVSEFSSYNLDLMGTVWGKLYKKQVIGNIRFNENIKYGEDIIFNFELFTDELSYCYIDDFSYQYTINNESTIRKYNDVAIKQYENTIMELQKKVDKKNNEKYNTYLLYICTFYRVICTNYICTKNNENQLKIKLLQIKQLSLSKYFKFGIDDANLKFMRLSRRIPIILARKNMFVLLYLVIYIRNIQTKLL